MEIYATLLNLLKQNLLNRDIDHVGRENNFQETAVPGFIPQVDDKFKGQSDSSVIEMQDYLVDEQANVEQPQTISEAKPLTILEVPTKEDPAGEGTEIGNVSLENTEVSSQIVSSEVPDFSRLVKRELLKRIKGKSLEEDHPGVLGNKRKT